MGLSDRLFGEGDDTGAGEGVQSNSPLPDEVPLSASGKVRKQSATESQTDRDVFFGCSRASQLLLAEICRAARSPYPVLFTGPSGSGKTTLAKYLHEHSARKSGPFIARSLTSIPEELRHAELVGSVRGAYTGATVDRVGLLERAHSGTLFLDELGYASPALQQTLLTIVEHCIVQRLGEAKDRKVDVRFVFATSADLEKLQDNRRMLRELIWRINTHAIEVPPLRDRREDIEPLAMRFLEQSFRETDRTFPVAISPALVAWLRQQPWPGNLRELQTVCRRLACCAQPECELDVVDLELSAHVGKRMPQLLAPSERAHAMLKRCGGNKSKAARELGMSRTTFYRTLAKTDRA